MSSHFRLRARAVLAALAAATFVGAGPAPAQATESVIASATAPSASGWMTCSGPGTGFLTSFVPTRTAPVGRVTMPFRAYSDQVLEVQLRELSGGPASAPLATALASTTVSVPASNTSTTVEALFPTPPVLTAGTGYAIAVLSTGNCISGPDSYPGFTPGGDDQHGWFLLYGNMLPAADFRFAFSVYGGDPTPPAPTCSGDALTAPFNTAATATFSCSGTDLTYSVVSGPEHGSLDAISGNTVSYSPNGGFAGTDTFTVRATDSAGQTADDTVAVTVDGALDVLADADDQLTGQDADAAWSLDAGQTDTWTLSCAPGRVAVDGHPLVQAVDQGTGRPADVQVLTSTRIDAGTYEFTLHNPASGRAQGHLAVSCISSETFKGHALELTDVASQTVSIDDGTAAATLTCGDGATPVAPGYRVVGGGSDAVVRQTTGDATADGTGWRFAFTASTGADIELTLGCLTYRDTAGQVLLQSQRLSSVATVAGGAKQDTAVDCPVGYVGLVGGFSSPASLAHLGQETQAKRRLFWLENTTDTETSATLSLLCVGLVTTTTSSPITPAGAPVPAGGSTEAPTETRRAVAPQAESLTGSESVALVTARKSVPVGARGKFAVKVRCDGTAACKGTAKLTVGKRTIAQGPFSLEAGSTGSVALRLTAKGRRSLAKASRGRLAAQLTLGSAAPARVTLVG